MDLLIHRKKLTTPWSPFRNVEQILVELLMLPLSISPSDLVLQIDWIKELEEAARTARGWPGLGIIAVYSFLIAFILPFPSEVVLVAPLDLGIGYHGRVSLIMLVSGLGKAAGSVFAFHIGQEVKKSGPVIRFIENRGIDIVEYSEKKTVEVARKWGYVGLALALCVPGFPDTASIYAFTILEEDYVKFAIATFVGSIGRLMLFVVGWEVFIFFV